MPQWGTPVAAAADKGDQSLALTGLAATGTLRSGTAFGLVHNGQAASYYLTADAEITAGAATITFGPSLVGAVVEGARVVPEPRRKSLYNKRTGRMFFSDPELQDLAARAMSLRGRFIRGADDPDNALFRSVRYYAWTAMLSSDEYLSGQDKGIVDGKLKLIAQDSAIVFSDQVGPQNVSFVR